MSQRSTRSKGSASNPLQIAAAAAASAAVTGVAQKVANLPPVEGGHPGDPMGTGEGDALVEYVSLPSQAQMIQAAISAGITAALAAQQPTMGTRADVDADARMSPVASPQHSPAGSPRSGPQPRLTDLANYEGAGGAKLDSWLDDLTQIAGYYSLTDDRAAAFGVVHLKGTALQWWNTLGKSVQATMQDVASLAAALRSRFQPITTEDTARSELYKLEQANRGVDAFISDFQRLCALIPTASEADKLFNFLRGVRRDIGDRIRVDGTRTVEKAIETAARMGNLTSSAPSGSGTHPSRLQQMELDGPAVAVQDSRLDRIEATLHAIAQQNSFGSEGPAGGYKGLGAKTQTQRSYRQQGQGGSGNRPSNRQQRPPIQVPGVSPEELQRRLTERLCTRCGEPGHNSHACPNSIKPSN